MIQISRYAIATLLMMGSCTSSMATDYYVRVSGNDKNSGTSAKSAFATIDYAISKCVSNSDRVYVGAGKYSANVVRSMPKSQRLQILGDLKGKHTGDAGRPILTGKPNAWSMTLYNGLDVSISGVQFEGESGGNYYGLRLTALSGGLTLSDCWFNNLYMAADLYSNGGLSNVDSSQFSKIQHIGLYVRACELKIQNSQLNDCRYAVYGHDLTKFSIKKSDFKSDGINSTLAVYMNNTAVEIDSINVVGYDTAIQSTNSKSLSVANAELSSIKSWGIYGTGAKCAISNVAISGKTSGGGYGISYTATTEDNPSLTNVSVQTLYCGIRNDGGRTYDFKNVSSYGNHIGYYAYNMPALALKNVRKGGLHLDNNIYGMYIANAADKPGSLSLSNGEVSNNDYGLFANNVSVQLDKCIFQKNSRAVYALNSPSATLSNCDVSDNTARNTWSHFGVRLDAKEISVSNSSFLRNDYGLYLTNLADKSPKLSDIKIDSNKDYGLLVSGGRLYLDGSANVEVSNSNYGLWTNNCSATIEGWNGLSKVNYSYYMVGGDVELRGCNVAGGVIAVYAQTQKSLSLEKCSFQGQSAHGLYAHLPEKLSVESCSIDSAKSHALYCYKVNSPADSVSINNLKISNSVIGARFIGVPISSKNLQNLTLKTNTHGLRVEQASLDLTPEMNIDASGNQYAVLSYTGKLTANGFSCSDNLIALYAYQSPTELVDTKLSSTSYGAIFYGSPVSANGLSVSTATYGIYYDPQSLNDCTLSISDSIFSNLGSIAIRAAGRDNSKDVILKNISISGGSYGLYMSSNNLRAEDIRCNDVKAYSVYTYGGENQIRRLVANKSGSWSVYAAEGILNLIDSQVSGGHGVLLGSQSSSIVNTVVSGTTYGVYSNKKDGQYSVVNSTIVGVQYDGVLANLGKVQVTNSIIQSGRFGIFDVTGTNTSHDYNVISSGSSAFRNTTGRKNEILKSPLFVNAASGDFRLQSGSPAINSGLDLSSISKTDIVGAARGSFGRFEIGAYEYLEKEGSLRVLDWDEKAE